MIVMIDIEGKLQTLDLTRVRGVAELHIGSHVVARHPETRGLCKAVVVSINESSITVLELARVIAPYRWNIMKESLYHAVYKIGKQ